MRSDNSNASKSTVFLTALIVWALIALPNFAVGQAPVIDCPGDTALTLNDIGEVIIEVPITGWDNVEVDTTAGGWADDTLRLTISLPIADTFTVIASTAANDTSFCEIVVKFPGVTIKSGTIDGETWTSAESPYCILSNIIVANLSIEPGVAILFFGNYTFDVPGILVAEGSKIDSILFSIGPDQPRWGGLNLNNTTGVSLQFCIIEWADNSGLRVDNSELNIRNCTIRNNRTRSINSDVRPKGGGIWANCPLEMTDCAIISNSVKIDHCCAGEGPWSAYGGGLYAADSLVLNGCIFSGNSVTSDCAGIDCRTESFGGGIYAQGIALLSCCIIKQNLVTAYRPWNGGSANTFGGGAYFADQILMVNCIVKDNIQNAESNQYGGGLYTNGGSIINCTFKDNETYGIYGNGDSVSVLNSILWDNTGSQLFKNYHVSYSCFNEADTSGVNPDSLIALNPVFYNQDSLTLTSISPCIDAGDPEETYNDYEDPYDPGNALWPSRGTVRNDMGAYGGPGAIGWLGPQIFTPPVADTIEFYHDPDSECVYVEVCISVPIINYDTVIVGGTYGSWMNDSLCFTPDSFGTYIFAITAINGGDTVTADVEVLIDCLLGVQEIGDRSSLPEQFELRQNYPNPFNPFTIIEFALPRRSLVTIDIYNIIGQKVTTLADEKLPAGTYSVDWDGTNSNGVEVSSGVYFYKITANDFTETKSMILLK